MFGRGGESAVAIEYQFALGDPSAAFLSRSCLQSSLVADLMVALACDLEKVICVVSVDSLKASRGAVWSALPLPVMFV